MRWLQRWAVEGLVLRLKTKRRSDSFITSKRHGEDESITEDGTHYGVEVLSRVFDNLSSEGLTREDWLDDFSCRSGGFTIEEMSLSALEAQLT